MHLFRVVVASALALVIAGTAQATSLLPLATAANENGFGTLHASLSSPFTGGGFRGVLDSRVYVNAVPATQVTFVLDLRITQAFTGVEDMTLAAVFANGDMDLRIGEIIGGVNGYVTSTTTKIPNSADAYDHVFPASDQLNYGWVGTNRLFTNSRAVMYVITSGAVDVGEISVAIQDGSTANARALAPVDDPSNPDMNIPEPTSLALLALGTLLLRRR
ncbi:MAG TPA: PEP-CTERM sorting domain-containing protein [Phycisphaerae bacterium]|nr:PEP-CTERM sorting domain-containing protein [Phycisphaerae bacterium]